MNILFSIEKQNERIYTKVYDYVDADFLHSPILTTIDFNSWKMLLSRQKFKERTWESWHDYLVGILKWAVGNGNQVERGQVKELLGQIDLTEITQTR